MAVYEVFSQPEVRRYKTHICSKASLIQLFCILLTFIPPFFIAYKSKGFWQRVDVYYEQGDVHFNHEVIALLQLQNEQLSYDYITWSTMQNFNQLHLQKLRIPLVKAREEDSNRDGRNDLLYFSMEIPLQDHENVIGVQLLLFFDYQLHKFSSLEMESMAHIQYNSAAPGVLLTSVGDLKLKLREPLEHKGEDTRYNEKIVDSTSIFAEDYELKPIFTRYSARNVSTIYTDDFSVWTAGRPVGVPFTVDVQVRYPEELIRYSPGLWQLLKWGWIQYAAILIVFLFVIDRIKMFIFQNQLVTTMVDRPFKQKPF